MPEETTRDDETGELPDAVVDAAERLTRLARDAVDENEAAAYRGRRDEILAERDFTSRVREEDETLVLHPEEWLADDGTVRIDSIDDTGRAYEIPLTGADVDGDWEAVEAHNAGLVDSVEAEHGPAHAANVRAFADFMGNHYVRRVDTASRAEIREFLSEYYPRNTWPSEKQESVVRDSIELAFDAADADVPEF
ncbi:DUF7108 family protein [Halogeometricum limi]|uniref:RnhA operon protein n=1 Tax=Halogeometricum limi TaxID=555875 RepID=A0A1I6G5T8_9EURY|nr:rnhA operon protein [Halogeometricum limi]SFR37552.1 hypothetical protein SAMN04488124_0915 [Halogeometricum limi]